MNTTVWLIRFTSEGVRRRVVFTHNALADYLALDPTATAEIIDCAAVDELIKAANGLLDVTGRAKVCTVTESLAAYRRLESALAAVSPQP
jgi:hypothetical protein